MPVFPSSDSSDDEENLELFREAVDPTFSNVATSTFYKGKTQEIDGLKSLRKTQDEDDQFNELKVTPEFQKFVAGKLEQILEKDLSKRLAETPVTKTHTGEGDGGGIKLLRGSKDYLSLEEDVPKYKKMRVKKDDSNESEKVKEAAVDPQRIYSKEDIKHWASLHTKPHFKYKKDTSSGKLVLIKQ